MIKAYILFSLLFLVSGCVDKPRQTDIDNFMDKGGRWDDEQREPLYSPNQIDESKSVREVNTIEGNTIKTRFQPPRGFKRTAEEMGSFGEYLRDLSLKPVDAVVRHFDGRTKWNHNIYCGVVDLDIGKRDLHQCADAAIRLKAEYHWWKKEYEKIHFNLTNGFNVEYTEWMKGRRVQVKGNQTKWGEAGELSNTYSDFWQYLELVFMYAGTASLEKELEPIGESEPKIGDILIQGGYPGHAVIIVDRAINKVNGANLYLLAQSYMPAQEIQILVNQNDTALSPWYNLERDVIETPEWRFTKDQIRRYKE